MLTRIVIVLLAILVAHSKSYSWEIPKGAAYIADGTANLEVVARVIDAATHKPVVGATVTEIRSGRGTLPFSDDDSAAMPPPTKTDVRGRAVLRANFRWAGVESGSSVFVARSFLRVRAAGFRSIQVRISAIGRLDFAPRTKHYRVTIPIALMHE
jgi:hypothetical protein